MSFTKHLSLIFLFSLILSSACTPTSDPIAPVTALPTRTANPTTISSATPEVVTNPTTTSTPTATLEDLSNAETTNTRAESAFPTVPPIQFAGLAPGEARAIAQATDTLLQPTPRNFIRFEESPVPLLFGEFYDGYNMRTGLVISDKLLSLDGQQIVIEGYVAPPLKPLLDFFVLTRIQLQFCPFCNTAADWPDDIVLVYLPDPQIIGAEYPVRITGRLETGISVDAETGMVSLVRLYAENIEEIR